jgi:PAT family beta-lactamase induction signal transducer AmpG
MMVVTLLLAMPVSFKNQLGLFTAIILIHNFFAATQDVAIDALAVNVLEPGERGLANGLMFGGNYVGIALGGAGVLLLTPLVGFQSTFLFVAAAIALVTLLVPLPMREAPGPPRAWGEGSRAVAVGRELKRFVRDAGAAFLGSRAAFVAIFLALLPMGAYALSLSLQANLAVDLGLDDRHVGLLGFASTILSAGFCILGGWLSDRFGRRRTLALFIAGTTIPTFALALVMQRFGWILPVNQLDPNRAVPPEALVSIFWGLTLSYSVFQGLMYGVGTAIYMDVTTRAVAATQFTAYMALCNIVYSYSSTWQGNALQRWGYPATLTIDAIIGLVCLLLLPLMGRKRRDPIDAIPSAA